MTSDFHIRQDVGQSAPEEATARDLGDRSPEVPDAMKRDRFELLSAYLDGEVTVEERRLVESWLDHDSTVQQLYQRLLRLRHSFQACPVPQSEQSVDVTVQKVLQRVDRRTHRLTLVGGGAIAAVVVGALSSLFIGPALRQQMAQSPEPEIPTEGLQIALDQPLMDIPKAPEASYNGNQPSLYEPHTDIR